MRRLPTLEIPKRALRCAGFALPPLIAALPAGAQSQEWFVPIPANADVALRAAARDGAGGVFAGGATRGDLGAPNAGLMDAWLARHDGAGQSLWVRQLGSSAQDELAAAAPDGAGGAFVCGFTEGDLAAPNLGSEDIWLARFDGGGGLLWVQQLGTGRPDQPTSLVADGTGGVFLAGWSFGDMGAPNAGQADAWLAHHDGAGNQTWIRQLGTLASDSANTVAVDGAGGVFVAGHTDGSLGGPAVAQRDSWLARYDGAGNSLWIRQPGTSDPDWFVSAVVDGAGGVIAVGSSGGGLGGARLVPRLMRYDGLGNALWERSFGASGVVLRAQAAAPDGAGGVFVAGETYMASPDDSWLAHYDRAGTARWSLHFGGPERATCVAAASDDAGGVFLGGSMGGAYGASYEGWLARYGPCDPAVIQARNAGTNPASLQAGPPVLGSTFTATVDLTTTGHALALLVALDGQVDVALPGGQHLLIADRYGHGLLYRGVQSGPLATFTFLVPFDPVLCGFPLSMQARHLGGLVPFALSNAQDLVLGN